MRSKLNWVIERRGVLLVMIASIATLLLGASKQLNLYIHPRYNIFSLIASAGGLLVSVWCLSLASDDSKAMSRKVYYGNFLLVVYALASLLILKPAILTSSIANQRGINSGANTDALTKLANANVVSPFGNDNFSQLSVKDWASLLSQTNDPTFFAGKEANFTGFIAPDQQGSDDYFYTSRFVISCCAVDARPIGVPVRKTDWQKEFKSDQWIEIKGVFRIKDGRVAVDPTSINAIEQPKDPYVY